MSFKENLLKKIEIDKMANKVVSSIGPPGGDRKTDRKTMKALLDEGPFQYKTKRDLECYILGTESGKDKILVLDNELAIYHTGIDDVAMRKSPTVKEMVNIRNAIKILNDKDVVVSKREESVETIRRECIGGIDLSFTPADLDAIERDGVASLERDYMDGVLECLSLFAEILEYKTAPKPFRVSRNEIIGRLSRKESGEILFGPMVIYSLIHNTIKLIDKQVGGFDKGEIEWIHKVAMDQEKAAMEGAEVFGYLKAEVS